MLNKISCYFILILFTILLPIKVISQINKKVEDHYLEYFKLPRESIYIHTNKTTYLANEELWFRIYTLDRKNNLTSKKTTNIQVGLYNKEGKQIEKKLFLAKNGMASGNILLESNLNSGEYYLKASTNWMRNFNEDDSFIKKITVINTTQEKKQPKLLSKKEYDFQFLPESGNMLSGVKNIIGFKVIDNEGKGTIVSGNIINSKDEIITSFKSNLLGIGRFSFLPLKNEEYKANLLLKNEKEISTDLPKVNNIGIVLSLNNTNSKNLFLTYQMNDDSFKILKNKAYKILINKDGYVKSLNLLLDSKTKKITIPKKSLLFGTNILTTFNEDNKPILERLFFNKKDGFLNTNVTLELKNKSIDSFNFNLKSDINSKLINTSISILPSETKSYTPRHNIISAFYIKPYVNGTIENPRYYFKNFDRKKAFELDMLLLTQGWSRYSWDNIFNNKPKPNFEFENGITIRGTINNKLTKVKSLLLYPTTLNKSRFINYNNKGKFVIKNFYPLSNEALKFSLTNNRGKVKPPLIAVSSNYNLYKDSINIENYKGYTSYNNEENIIPLDFLDGEDELLDEVVISTRLNRVYKKVGPPFQGAIIKINDTIAKQYVTIDQILNQHRFIIEYGADLKIRSLNKKRPRPVFFYLDGNLIKNMHGFLTSNTTKYEDLYIDYSYNNVLVEGLNYPESILVNIFSRTSLFDDFDLNSTLFRSIKLNSTFTKVKKFYTPKYITYNTKSYKDYGIIYWNPNVVLSKNNDKTISFKNTGIKNYKVFIEGITDDGKLISQEKIITVK